MRDAGVLDVMHRPLPAHARTQPQRAERHPILRLQQTAGNAAVQRLVLAQREIGVQRETERDAARERRYTDAMTAGDWAGVVDVLRNADEKWMAQRLVGMSAGQLRYLSDAVRRAGANSTMLGRLVNAGLMQQAFRAGTEYGSAMPGAGYGVIEGKATSITDGKIVPGGNNQRASYRFEISFMPNTKVVQATQIEFIQMARVVSTVNTAPDPVGVPVGQNAGANGPRRQTADHSRIDRVTNMNQGWIGVANTGQPIAGHLRPWTPGSKQPAWMEDTPSRTVPNVDFSFETAAVCRTGADAGMVYATVSWGFTIDANMKIIPKDPVYFNKESHDFDLAVTFWNTEAAQTGSTQQPLPASLR